MLKILVGSVLLASAAVSSAVPLQFTNCVDSTNGTAAGVEAAAAATCSAATPTNNLLLTPISTNTLTFAHNVLGNGFLTTDSIVSATLVIDLRDDQGASDGSEKMSISIDFNGNGSFVDAGEQVANDIAVGAFSCLGACNTALLAGLADGIAAIRLEVVPGSGGDRDFLFVDSLLTVNVNRNGDGLEISNGTVPEPGMLALLAVGLGGLGFASSKRRKTLV